MKKKFHYYPDGKSDLDRMTACGRDGRKSGGLISSFFKIINHEDRCKICLKQFKKDRKKGLTKL